jgi:iron complex outermembrane receptor protein
VGNKAFVSERLVGSEAGYRTLLLKNLYVDVAAFHNNYDDLFGFGPGGVLVEPLPAPAHIVLQVPISNALRGQTDGVEIAPDWKPSDWLEVKGSYSYLYLHVHDKPGFTDTLNAVPDNGSSPHHQVQFRFLFNLPKNFELDPSFRYVSALPAQAVPSYETADLRFGWHPSPHWEFSIDGQNLLQPHHPEFGGDADTIVGIDRSVYAKITWRK